MNTTHLVITPLQLSDYLKAIRKQLGMTQADIAAHLGLSQNRVSHLENHPEDISFRQLLAWAAALNLRVGFTHKETEAAAHKAEW